MRTRKGRKVTRKFYFKLARGNGKPFKSYEQMLELIATHTGRRC